MFAPFYLILVNATCIKVIYLSIKTYIKKMEVKLIVAKSKNNVIGKENELIWKLPADLSFFKQTTLGNTIVMGRKTFESIGRALPGRKTIIITKNRNYKQKNCTIAHSIEEALDVCEKDANVYIVGGSTIYKQVLNKGIVDELLVTEVHEVFDGDAFFPEISTSQWLEVSREFRSADEKNKYDISFVKYKKKA